jgi:type II secretory pathway pseudopilin PulG
MSNQKNKRREHDSGIALLEVTLAIVIIAVFVLLLVASRGDIISTASNANSLRIARMLASQTLEEVLLAEAAEEEQEAGGTFENYPGFTWEESAYDVPLTTGEERDDYPGLQEMYVRHITVTVKYENAEGTEVEYSLATILPYKEEAQEGSGGSGK